MIYVNSKEKIDKLKDINNYCVIADFDHTLTTSKSQPSIGIIPHFLGGECLEKRTKIFNYYRPIELDYTIKHEEKQKIMREWARKSFTLLSKFTTEEVINEALENNPNLHLKEGVSEFLFKTHKNNIPVIIMSAGVGNLIGKFLEKQGILYDNVEIVSNFFLNLIIGKTYMDLENIIATSNKDYYKIPENIRKNIESKEKIILFGDIVEDISMINNDQLNKTITIGFLDYNIDINLKAYNKNYDIVLAEGENFNSLNKISY